MFLPWLVGVLFGTLVFTSAADAEVTLSSERVPGAGSMAVIRIDGPIRAGEDVMFRTVADQAARATQGRLNGAPFIFVDLSSSGGDVAASLRIGLLIRDRAMITRVDGECDSACAFILMAGVSRSIRDRDIVGLHRPTFPASEFADLPTQEATAKYNAMVEQVRAYWFAMGGTPEAWRIIMLTASTDLYPVRGYREALDLGLAGDDPAWRELSIAKLRR